jgi:hypothetical protein
MAAARGTRTPKLAARLTAWRDGRSFGAVAQALSRFVPGTHKSTLFNYEEQARCPRIDVLWGLCQVYGVPFADAAEAMARELLGLESERDIAPIATRSVLSADAAALAAAFEGWDREKQRAFLKIAGVQDARASQPQSDAPPPAHRAAARGNRTRG